MMLVIMKNLEGKKMISMHKIKYKLYGGKNSFEKYM